MYEYHWDTNDRHPAPYTDDPRFPGGRLGRGADAPRIYLDGQNINGSILWCRSGDPGMAVVYDKDAGGKFQIAPVSKRAKLKVLTGKLEVHPNEPGRA